MSVTSSVRRCAPADDGPSPMYVTAFRSNVKVSLVETYWSISLSILKDEIPSGDFTGVLVRVRHCISASFIAHTSSTNILRKLLRGIVCRPGKRERAAHAMYNRC